MLRIFSTFIVAAFLTGIALWRGDFSISKISSSLPQGQEIKALSCLDQPFYFLGKGKQSFAFVSKDGKFVLKFFNQKYFKMPWYSFVFQDRELAKRVRRERFYRESYLVADTFLREKTGLIQCHFEKTKGLPKVRLRDKASRDFVVDLNEVSFVLQKKGDPFYPTLDAICESQGKEGFSLAIRGFFEMVAFRISLSIEDGDQNVEHNYGFLDGKPFQLDPGRLLLGDFSNPSKVSHEWWVATHSFRKWLEKTHPDMVPVFDEMQKEYQGI